MTFGERLRSIRKSRNISQAEFSKLTGISERSLYTYEQLGTMPRPGNIRKIAEALSLPVSELLEPVPSYTTHGTLSDPDLSSHAVPSGHESDLFLTEARNEFGNRGAKEAQDILDRAGALFAGGDLDEDSKEVFFHALMEVYMDSKRTAREKYTPRKFRDPDSGH